MSTPDVGAPESFGRHITIPRLISSKATMIVMNRKKMRRQMNDVFYIKKEGDFEKVRQQFEAS